MKPYVRVNATTRETQEFDNSIFRVFQSLSTNLLLNSPVLVQNVVFTNTSDSVVYHKLGRAAVGYIITNLNAPQTIYKSATTNTNPNTQIILKADGTVTADILFF